LQGVFKHLCVRVSSILLKFLRRRFKTVAKALRHLLALLRLLVTVFDYAPVKSVSKILTKELPLGKYPLNNQHDYERGPAST
jgi:hypothetical protein